MEANKSETSLSLVENLARKNKVISIFVRNAT